jgi:hypothetical protein
MPIIRALEMRDASDADARLIGLAAAIRTYGEHGVFDGEVMRKYVAQLAQDDMSLIARAMSVAQWVAGREKH